MKKLISVILIVTTVLTGTIIVAAQEQPVRSARQDNNIEFCQIRDNCPYDNRRHQRDEIRVNRFRDLDNRQTRSERPFQSYDERAQCRQYDDNTDCRRRGVNNRNNTRRSLCSEIRLDAVN